MSIQFACSACGKKLAVKDENAGRRSKCPACGGEIVVPMGEAIATVDHVAAPAQIAPPPVPAVQTHVQTSEADGLVVAPGDNRFFAWISAHPPWASFIGVCLALATFLAYTTVADLLSKPSRLHEGEEVVLMAKPSVVPGVENHDVCVVVGDDQNERTRDNVLFIGESQMGDVLEDKGSIWAIDREVKVRLRGPAGVGKGYRDGKPFYVTLGEDRKVIWVGRSHLERLDEAVARRSRERPSRREEAASVIVEKKAKVDETSRLAPGEQVVLLENEGSLSRGITIATGDGVIFVPDGTRGTVLIDEDGDRHNYHPARPVKVRLKGTRLEGYVLRHELARTDEALARRHSK